MNSVGKRKQKFSAEFDHDQNVNHVDLLDTFVIALI